MSTWEGRLVVPALHYAHVTNKTTQITRLETGPKNVSLLQNEEIVQRPAKMITLPPGHYCIIRNPVIRGRSGQVLSDQDGQARVDFGECEVRTSSKPFPLYPGEVLSTGSTPFPVLDANTGLYLHVLRSFTDKTGQWDPGDKILFEGPGVYAPRKEVEVLEEVPAILLEVNEALKLKANRDCYDYQSIPRETGEEWLVKDTRAYIPGPYEEVQEVVDAITIDPFTALHIKALATFTDDDGVERLGGQEWLIQGNHKTMHFLSVYEALVAKVAITAISARQYCVIVNPVDGKGGHRFGARKLVRGPKAFFLQPGEYLDDGVKDIIVLGEDEGVVLSAREDFVDKILVSMPNDQDGFIDRLAAWWRWAARRNERHIIQKVKRCAGDLWMRVGPDDYIPPLEVQVIARRKAIQLDKNEGIYVRDLKTGHIRVVCGKTYMLTQDEELWEKALPTDVEQLLAAVKKGKKRGRSKGIGSLDKTRAVTYRVPHNAAVQIYDYRGNKPRIVFGPEFVMLGPHEQLTVFSLSDGTPMVEDQVKSLHLMLGPDFCTDKFNVETADHACLCLQLSYNWHFEVKNKDNFEEAVKLFSVPDFLGNMCKAIASRVRGTVAAVNFQDFHKNSGHIIQASVFGFDKDGQIQPRLLYSENNLVVSSIDIQSVEPIDQRTRDSLQKSVQLAIEITTNSQEAAARHQAQNEEQKVTSSLRQQKFSDEAKAERHRKELLRLQVESATIERLGQAKAEAIAWAESSRIEGAAALEQTRLKAEAKKIEADAELERLKQAREAELNYKAKQHELEIAKAREMSSIMAERFDNMVKSVGADTLSAMALAGPELQLKLLKGLGLQSTLITNGNTPFNLFHTAQALSGVPEVNMGKNPNKVIFKAKEHFESSDKVFGKAS